MSDQEQNPAKRPATILAGPYGHPFHAIAITIPIGAWVASLVFDIIGLISADPAPYATGSRVLIAIGLLGSIPAIIFGIHDYLRIPDRTRASSAATIHMGINFLVCGAYLFQFFLRTTTGEIPMFAFVFSIVSLLFLSFSGWLGGKLAYRWGIRVAAETTQGEAFRVPERP
ncbi:hypothetical protein CVS47_00680 [Microbacterium lemovicicum]|uniref:DUF2231 domain-containing protein n=1 Tax=Microbacterium lemovicicum TaxID=1072463 RepID=A0A3S9W7M7_9MICO|nr:DUF2231 domain-containing protein [Microbacterium lemovicicum]AZS36081.1 hypothetical protein CVS47_00680 [Microbacterium lemovicicum]